MWENARAPPPARTRPSDRPASRSARARTPLARSPSTRVSCQASVAATQATRCAGAGGVPSSTTSGCRTGPGSTWGGASDPLRATSTTASAWRRQKSRQDASVGSAPSSATRTTRSWSRSARSRPSGPITPGATTSRCTARRRVRAPATSAAPEPACRPTTAITDGCGGRVRGGGPPAVRSRSATWVSTKRAAAASVASIVSKASLGISSTVESRRARTPAERCSPVSRASSPSTSPGPSSRTSRSATCDVEPARPHHVRGARRVSLAHQPGPGGDRHDLGRLLEAAAGLDRQRRQHRDVGEVTEVDAGPRRCRRPIVGGSAGRRGPPGRRRATARSRGRASACRAGAR